MTLSLIQSALFSKFLFPISPALFFSQLPSLPFTAQAASPFPAQVNFIRDLFLLYLSILFFLVEFTPVLSPNLSSCYQSIESLHQPRPNLVLSPAPFTT